MTQAERELRVKELNQKCKECREQFVKEGLTPPSGRSCLQFCQTGREIHKLEDPKWDQQDWNSSKLENLYHN